MFNEAPRSLLVMCTSVAGLLLGLGRADAGGLALREQSTYAQGASYAGVAAGGALSSMFWNPATLTQLAGVRTEVVLSGVLPYSANSAATLGQIGTGNIARDAVIPSGYFSWQVDPKLWLGLSVNAPYGLAESFPDVWAGRPYGAGDNHLTTYNATPTIAYAVNEWLSVGVGIQFQYADATLTKGIGALLGDRVSISGKGWGYGLTAGITIRPSPTTTVGIGYRSALDQKLDGGLVLPPGPLFNPPFSTPGPISTTLNLPDLVSFGLRQKLEPHWTAMATVEWSNWSRLGTSNVSQPNGQTALVLSGLGGGGVTIPFQYKDGWFFSLGAEYQWNDQLALRGGIGFEKSPVTDQVRVPIVADDDRTWLSIGASYNYSNQLSLDLAYSHLFVKDAPINISNASNPSFNGAVYTGSVDSHIDIVSLALRYRWDEPATARRGSLYTK